ncbi:type II/IV secretion system ATPase [Palaeococcus pacificus DY20341]|uniref:Type II/IV secretion system ATPase n=1 Tax=Palaeococcus pacificus DY20341 TaxID=1343739 RepID=A0A075LQD0_9EURY|nr:type II/IV secretion system ATPase [Palaeococcus pacificus DY20341]
MEDKKKKKSGLSWIEEILGSENTPLDTLIKREEPKVSKEELPPKPSSLFDILSSEKPGKEEVLLTKKAKTDVSKAGPPLPSPTKRGGLSLQELLGKPETESFQLPSATTGEVKVLDAYGNVRIIRIKGEPVPIYEIRIPELSSEEQRLLKMARDRAIVEIQLDPESIPNVEERRRIFLKAVRAMVKEMAPTFSEGRIEVITELIVQNMIGYGRLDPLIRDDNLEEVMVIGTNKPVYVWHRRFNMCKTNIVFKDDKEILNIIERIAREIGRRIDQQSPLLDARLPDGSRVNATIPPISLEGPTITIRKFKKDPLTVIDLIKYGTLNTDIAAMLWIMVDGLGVKPANVLVSGGTGSGKTTLLNSLAMFIPPSERVISIEDTAELQLPIEHWVRLETRPPNIEGKGEVTMDDLVKNTLRMRPDRIIVGEVRGPEARTMFTAMNTGHDGCMGTIHANSARETIVRLESPPMNVPRIMIPALDIILMLVRFHSRKKGTIRRITEIAEVSGIEGESVQLNKLYKYDPAKDELVPTGVPSRFMNILSQHTGMTPLELEIEKEKRKLVLDWMIERGIRDIEEVGYYIKEFYISPEDLIKKIERDSTVELAQRAQKLS